MSNWMVWSGAGKSLRLSCDPKFHICDRYSSFHGAFVGLLTNNDTKIDYLGIGLGDEELLYNDMPCLSITPSAKTVPSTLHKRQPTPELHLELGFPVLLIRFPAILPPPNTQTPRIPKTPTCSSGISQNMTFLMSYHNVPGDNRPAGINVEVSLFVNVHVHGESLPSLNALGTILLNFLGSPSHGCDIHTDSPTFMSPSHMRNPGHWECSVVPDYGYWFNYYWETHFRGISTHTLHQAFTNSHSKQDFIEHVANQAIPEGAAQYLFQLISECPTWH